MTAAAPLSIPLPDLLTCPPPKEGDAVVHLDYGLCRLGSARHLQLSDGAVHTVELHFKDGDSLHVPLADAVRIWAYGAELPSAKLDALGTEDWAAGQVERVRELGRSLHAILDRKAERESRDCAAVELSDAELDAAGAGFAHTLTDDQRAALADLQSDLARAVPANRVLMGDVGSGKTEVAVRAMLAVAKTGRPVRLAAPTRVLARQHFQDIRERAKGLGLACALYSGDLSDAERAEVVEARPDLVVGTHGLLGEAWVGVPWALTVIDEEQKFGAKLKDVHAIPGHLLRLSATPIPKTLAEARIGLADVSVIAEYPSGRGKTDTAVLADSDSAIREAIAAELARNGQVVALCARIRDLKRVRARLKRLVPDAVFCTVHGQRRARRNRKCLRRFREGRVDVLMATSMLETGINIHNANTMLVFAPERFGLAQLHQLRGRIGRGSRDARFLMVESGAAEPTEGWEARRATLEALPRRGDGLHLALADSLQRGAGRVHDDAQSGHASEIGLELFEHLVAEAAGGETDVRALLGSVPKIVGDYDWGLGGSDRGEDDDNDGGGDGQGENALAAAFAQTRAALRAPLAVLADPEAGALSTVVAACAARGAVRAAWRGEDWVFTFADGTQEEVEGDVRALRAWGGGGASHPKRGAPGAMPRAKARHVPDTVPNTADAA